MDERTIADSWDVLARAGHAWAVFVDRCAEANNEFAVNIARQRLSNIARQMQDIVTNAH